MFKIYKLAFSNQKKKEKKEKEKRKWHLLARHKVFRQQNKSDNHVGKTWIKQ